MHCLYCDRPLALLKRLTGDGEFCSKEHRRIYQKEHNQLALARLLEAQPSGKARQRPVNPQTEQPPAPPAPAPAPAPAAKTRDERQPQCAGFQSDFLREASAVSDANRLTGAPRFQGNSPVLAEPAQESEDRSKAGPRPKAAAFLSETLFFAGELRFPGKSVLEPFAVRPRLSGELPSDASMAPRPRPKGADFVVEQPPAPILNVRASQSSSAEPCFRPLAAANVSGLPHVRRDPRLPLAAFVPAAAIQANAIPDRIHNLAAEPRWKPLATVASTQPAGKIILVLVSFLRRPVRIASQDTLPESFEIRLQSISFPQYAPRMAILEERLHRTDRIGFTPP